jgi:hypothetical protein
MADEMGRRSTDVQITELASEIHAFREDFSEIKQLLLHGVMPRIQNLEEWRTTTVAIELERERNRKQEDRNRKQQEAGMVSKRQFWIGVATIIVGSAGMMATLLIALTPFIAK